MLQPEVTGKVSWGMKSSSWTVQGSHLFIFGTLISPI